MLKGHTPLSLPQTLPRPDGTLIAYYKSNGSRPGIVFIHGLVSDMTGTKAMCLERWCQAEGRAFVRFDCFGHGHSSGDFCTGTVGRWTEDAVVVLDTLTYGPQIIVGSSMGGWVALLATLRRPERVAGVVGIAVAVDFTEDIIWQQLSFVQREEIMQHGVITLSNRHGGSSYCISRELIEDGRKYLLLRNRSIAVTCPIRLIHGLADADIPWQTALLLQERIESSDVILTLVKQGGHRLSEAGSIQLMIDVVKDLIIKIHEGATD